MDYKALIDQNNKRWIGVEFHEEQMAAARRVAKRLCADKAKSVYLALEHATTVPWYVIAMIHEREASQSWAANIAQGDPWNRVSIHVPKGRGPFSSFFDAAVDALTKCAPFAAKWKDWSIGGLLTLLELYNGIGYEKYHHMASPYLWAGSNRYTRGKYVSDGHFDPNVVDTQLGCAVLYKAMTEIDGSIEAIPQSEEEPPAVSEHGPPEVDPDTYPDPKDARNSEKEAPNSVPLPPEKPPSWIEETVKRKAEDAVDDGSVFKRVKSLWKSRIGWATIGLGSSSVATNAPASALDRVWEFMHRPTFWLLLVNISLVLFVLYRYWKDHGKGSLR